jgi:hypothetical protein
LKRIGFLGGEWICPKRESDRKGKKEKGKNIDSRAKGSAHTKLAGRDVSKIPSTRHGQEIYKCLIL